MSALCAVKSRTGSSGSRGAVRAAWRCACAQARARSIRGVVSRRRLPGPQRQPLTLEDGPGFGRIVGKKDGPLVTPAEQAGCCSDQGQCRARKQARPEHHDGAMKGRIRLEVDRVPAALGRDAVHGMGIEQKEDAAMLALQGNALIKQGFNVLQLQRAMAFPKQDILAQIEAVAAAAVPNRSRRRSLSRCTVIATVNPLFPLPHQHKPIMDRRWMGNVLAARRFTIQGSVPGSSKGRLYGGKRRRRSSAIFRTACVPKPAPIIQVAVRWVRSQLPSTTSP
jgi:hypothetical protein